jgi:hypothetical protein
MTSTLPRRYPGTILMEGHDGPLTVPHSIMQLKQAASSHSHMLPRLCAQVSSTGPPSRAVSRPASEVLRTLDLRTQQHPRCQKASTWACQCCGPATCICGGILGRGTPTPLCVMQPWANQNWGPDSRMGARRRLGRVKTCTWQEGGAVQLWMPCSAAQVSHMRPNSAQRT